MTKKQLDCELTDCYFNSHDNLRFDDFGIPIGLCFCTADNDEEVFQEDNSGEGVNPDCPILIGLESLNEDEGRVVAPPKHAGAHQNQKKEGTT